MVYVNSGCGLKVMGQASSVHSVQLNRNIWEEDDSIYKAVFSSLIVLVWTRTADIVFVSLHINVLM